VHYSHYSQVAPPPTRQSRPTPWWVWVFGGVAAVSLGIAAALWYAGRGDSEPTRVTAQPTPTPPPPKPATAQPIEPPPAAPAALVELRFDSLPAGGVYADGRSAELCKTPCAFDVDPKDGGDKRKFVVKSAGYKDAMVDVDLAAAQREFHITLEREVADKPTERFEPADVPGKKDPRRVIRSTKKGNAKDDKVDKSAKDDKVDKPEKPVDKKPFDDHPIKPEDDKSAGEKRPDKKPPDKKPGSDTIDPSETLDPFRRPKPQ
jgi:hypothetical protein